MGRYILDTNHLSAALRKDSQFRDRIHAQARRGDQFGICFPILCEIEVGIRLTDSPPRVKSILNSLLRTIRIWPLDWPIVDRYAGVYAETVHKGRNLGFVDIIVAAIANEQKAIILTTDRDFEAIPNLKTENWLV